MRFKELFSIALCILITTQYATAAPGDEKWDYVEVRPGAHMFWWLMYSRVQDAPQNRPLVIWLTGGPGASSTGWGNFEEAGPLDWFLKPRNITWLDHSHLLFVDSPVGSGYSYVETPDLYTTTNLQIAQDLVTMLKSVLANSAPELATSPIFIFGESYGGKMGPEFALELQKAINAGEIEANLQGVIIRDGWPSPVDGVLSYAQYCLQTGLVDIDGYYAIDSLAQDCVLAMDEERWTDASELFDVIFLKIADLTFGVDVYYILDPLPPYYPSKKLSAADLLLRKQKNVNSRLLDEATLNELMNGPIFDKLSQTVPQLVVWGAQMDNVLTNLWVDFMKSTIPIVEEILNTTSLQVAVVNGQLDLIVDTEGTMQWVRKLNWPGSSNWPAAPRDPIVINNIVEGYIKQSGPLSMRWINRAGHSTFYFNPQTGFKMLQDLSGIP